ncbi:hypothetical protein BKI52_22515 [marine bacterium AO1-C]|nr:hypothetical protein BKI52_22515 [marine bacterium AO1-C]
MDILEATPKGTKINDQQFFDDFKALLDKYNNVDRFGICLLHNHFPIQEDEILVEENFANPRKLVLTVEKKISQEEKLAQGIIETSWRYSAKDNDFVALTDCRAHDDDDDTKPGGN